MGFRPDRLLTGQLFPADGHWPSDTTVWPRITAQALTALEAVPGVSGATLMIAPPFTAHLGVDATYMIEGEPTTALRTNPLIAMYTVRPGSFRTLGIPLIAGRDFTADDRATAAAPGAIVSAGLARRLGPGDPAGSEHVSVSARPPILGVLWSALSVTAGTATWKRHDQRSSGQTRGRGSPHSCSSFALAAIQPR